MNEEMKYNYIKDNIEKDLYHKRFPSVEALEGYLVNSYGIKGEEVDESGLTVDYLYLAGINSNYGYVDIYFTRGYDGIFITEIGVSE